MVLLVVVLVVLGVVLVIITIVASHYCYYDEKNTPRTVNLEILVFLGFS